MAPFISNQKKPKPYNSSQGASFRSKPLMNVLPRPRPLDSPLPVFWTFLFPFPLFQANSTLTNKANHFFKRSSILSYILHFTSSILQHLLAQCSLIYTIKIYNSKFAQLMKIILLPVGYYFVCCLLCGMSVSISAAVMRFVGQLSLCPPPPDPPYPPLKPLKRPHSYPPPLIGHLL